MNKLFNFLKEQYIKFDQGCKDHHNRYSNGLYGKHKIKKETAHCPVCKANFIKLNNGAVICDIHKLNMGFYCD